MTPRCARTLCLALLPLAIGCFQSHNAGESHSRCWMDDAAFSDLRKSAYFTFLEAQQGQADSLRRVVSVPLIQDSLAAHSEVIRDSDVCLKAGAASDALKPGERFAVLRVGRTYWVRSTARKWTAALDERFTLIATLIDPD